MVKVCKDFFRNIKSMRSCRNSDFQLVMLRSSLWHKPAMPGAVIAKKFILAVTACTVHRMRQHMSRYLSIKYNFVDSLITLNKEFLKVAENAIPRKIGIKSVTFKFVPCHKQIQKY